MATAGWRRRYVLGATPKSDESLSGFIFRLAERIGMSSGRSLARKAGFRYLTNRPDASALAGLTEIAGLDASELEVISYGPPDDNFAIFRGCRIPFPLLSGSLLKKKICPLCMGESAYYRSHWDLACVSVCHIHGISLVCGCSSCGKDLLWGSGSLTHCRCGQAIANIPAPAVLVSELPATRAVLGLLGDDGYTDEGKQVRSLLPFRDLTPVEVIEFIFRMGLDIRSPRGKFFSLEWIGDHGSTANEALTLGLKVALSWPSGFHLAIDERRRGWGPTPEAALTMCLQAIRRWLKSLPDGHGRVIAASLADYRAASRPIPAGYPFLADVRDLLAIDSKR